MCVADAVLVYCPICFQGLPLQDENKKRKQQNVVLGPQAGVPIDTTVSGGATTIICLMYHLYDSFSGMLLK